jgi:CPA2 family monovalent cation:H+ antiporter-2
MTFLVTMPEGSGAGAFRDLFVILGSAALLAVTLRRLRIALVPAYLLTGAVIGPRALGLVPDPAALESISSLAIILLLFGVGLELHIGILRSGVLSLLAMGLLACILSVLLGWPVAQAFGLRAPAALAVSMALALSSTAVVMRIFTERRQLRDAVGRTSLGILVTQDLLAILMLAVLPALRARSGFDEVHLDPGEFLTPRPGFLLEAALRISAAAALILVARRLLPRLLSESLRGRSLEVTLLLGLASALGAAVASHALGLSLEMGAFVAGFVLADTAFQSQLSGQIGPLRDLLVALFFTTLGMKLGPDIVLESGGIIVLGCAVLILLKTGVIGITTWALGAPLGTALAVGLSLAQAGEFSLIVLNASEGLGLLEPRHEGIVVAIVILSLLVTPGLLTLGRRVRRADSHPRLAPWIRVRRMEEAISGPREEPHVIIGGFGPLGRRLGQDLEEDGVRYVVVELNPQTVREAATSGQPAVLGDVGTVEVLESAGISRASALAITVSDDLAATRAVSVARRAAPGLFIVARVSTVFRVAAAREAGADLVLPDETAAADALARAILERRG